MNVKISFNLKTLLKLDLSNNEIQKTRWNYLELQLQNTLVI